MNQFGWSAQIPSLLALSAQVYSSLNNGIVTGDSKPGLVAREALTKTFTDFEIK